MITGDRGAEKRRKENIREKETKSEKPTTQQEERN
jgi:hypothetical protein